MKPYAERPLLIVLIVHAQFDRVLAKPGRSHHMIGLVEVIAKSKPKRRNNVRRSNKVAVASEYLKNERAIQMAVFEHEFVEGGHLLLRIAQFDLRAQVFAYWRASVLREHGFYPRDKVEYGHAGQEQQPEPQHYKKLLIQQVDRQRALNTVLMYIVSQISYFKIAECHSRFKMNKKLI